MKSFEYWSPTKILFGRETEERVGDEIRAFGGSRVLVVIGGGSVERSGLLARVERVLERSGLEHCLLKGVRPNPGLSLVHQGIELARQAKVDFVLAVGGGSVIDTAKGVALGVPYEGEVWDLYEHRAEPKTMLPVGSILTIPAAGSESSRASVITAEQEGGLKKGLNHPLLRPKFAILNPELTYTLPAYQTASGATDILMHTFERYFSKGDGNDLTDRIAESILSDVIRWAPIACAEPENEQARSELMWCGSLSHCDLSGLGMPGDWATHQMEHELSTAFHVAHGAGLSALWGTWARMVYREAPDRFAQYARNVWGLAGAEQGEALYGKAAEEEAALLGITMTEDFFRRIGMPVNLPQLLGRPMTDEEIKELAHKCTFFGTRTIGNLIVMREPEIEEVYRLANVEQ